MASFETFSYETDSNEDLRELEENLDRYVTARTKLGSPKPFSLVNVRQDLRSDPHGGRMFVSLLDIRMSVGMLFCDTVELGKAGNRAIAHIDGKDPLTSKEEEFDLRMNIHIVANSFVFRFRSFWDKVMGLYILRFMPQEYDRFCSAKSKKAMFQKLMVGIDGFEEFVPWTTSFIKDFDDRFRTPEAHGTGGLRKHTFSWITVEDCTSLALLNHWNFVNINAQTLGKHFDPALRPKDGELESQ